MNIREGGQEDISEITRELWLPLAREMEKVSDYNQLSSDLDLDQVREHKKDKLKDQERSIFLAEENGDSVGFLTVKISEKAPIFERDIEAKVVELYVKKRLQKTGCGL